MKRTDAFTTALLRLQDFLYQRFPDLTSRSIARISRYVEQHFALKSAK